MATESTSIETLQKTSAALEAMHLGIFTATPDDPSSFTEPVLPPHYAKLMRNMPHFLSVVDQVFSARWVASIDSTSELRQSWYDEIPLLAFEAMPGCAEFIHKNFSALLRATLHVEPQRLQGVHRSFKGLAADIASALEKPSPQDFLLGNELLGVGEREKKYNARRFSIFELLNETYGAFVASSLADESSIMAGFLRQLEYLLGLKRTGGRKKLEFITRSFEEGEKAGEQDAQLVAKIKQLTDETKQVFKDTLRDATVIRNTCMLACDYPVPDDTDSSDGDVDPFDSVSQQSIPSLSGTPSRASSVLSAATSVTSTVQLEWLACRELRLAQHPNAKLTLPLINFILCNLGKGPGVGGVRTFLGRGAQVTLKQFGRRLQAFKAAGADFSVYAQLAVFDSLLTIFSRHSQFKDGILKLLDIRQQKLRVARLQLSGVKTREVSNLQNNIEAVLSSAVFTERGIMGSVLHSLAGLVSGVAELEAMLPKITDDTWRTELQSTISAISTEVQQIQAVFVQYYTACAYFSGHAPTQEVLAQLPTPMQEAWNHACKVIPTHSHFTGPDGAVVAPLISPMLKHCIRVTASAGATDTARVASDSPVRLMGGETADDFLVDPPSLHRMHRART